MDSPEPFCEKAEQLLGKALQHHQQEEFEKAAPLYVEILETCGVQPDAAFYFSLLCNQVGADNKAVELLREALQETPDHPVLYFQLGTVYYEQGRVEEAISLFEETVRIDEGHWQAHYNLGTAYYALGLTDEAIAAYRAVLRKKPDDLDTLFNLGIACAASGKFSEALACYRQALEKQPDDIEVLYNLATTLKKMLHEDQAVKVFEHIVELRPGHAPAYTHLGALYVKLEKKDQAIDCYRKLISLDHNVEASRHILAALCGESTDRAPGEYVRDLFDQYAERFDQNLLEELEYKTPGMLRELLEKTVTLQKPFLNGLDLGCGTGLAALAFHDLVEHFTGVDISANMVEQARKKELYDRLEISELYAFLDAETGRYDFFVAADVLIYLGDLKPFFEKLGRCARPGSFLLFSTERSDGADFVLQQSGRYAHFPKALLRLAEQYGFSLLARERAGIRKEKGRWIAGDLYCLRSQA